MQEVPESYMKPQQNLYREAQSYTELPSGIIHYKYVV